MKWSIAIFKKGKSKHLCFGHHNYYFFSFLLFYFGAMGLLIGLYQKIMKSPLPK
jgi:hypothetical protein